MRTSKPYLTGTHEVLPETSWVDMARYASACDILTYSVRSMLCILSVPAQAFKPAIHGQIGTSWPAQNLWMTLGRITFRQYLPLSFRHSCRILTSHHCSLIF